jgi:hypothetical protein
MCTNPFQKIPKRKSSWIFNLSLTALFFFIFGTTSYAQCAMCRASLASEGNKTKAEAVNDGIVYLMVIPYVLVGGIGYAIYRMKKK